MYAACATISRLPLPEPHDLQLHCVGLVHKHHIRNEIPGIEAQRTCLMYHAACKVEFQPCNRSYSQLTFLNFVLKYLTKHANTSKCVPGT